MNRIEAVRNSVLGVLIAADIAGGVYYLRLGTELDEVSQKREQLEKGIRKNRELIQAAKFRVSVGGRLFMYGNCEPGVEPDESVTSAVGMSCEFLGEIKKGITTVSDDKIFSEKEVPLSENKDELVFH